jgi:hypothetical protein
MIECSQLSLVVHACNLSYSGGIGRKVMKPAQAKLAKPYLEREREREKRRRRRRRRKK